jgi:hypothetical protein
MLHEFKDACRVVILHYMYISIYHLGSDIGNAYTCDFGAR